MFINMERNLSSLRKRVGTRMEFWGWDFGDSWRRRYELRAHGCFLPMQCYILMSFNSMASSNERTETGLGLRDFFFSFSFGFVCDKMGRIKKNHGPSNF